MKQQSFLVYTLLTASLLFLACSCSPTTKHATEESLYSIPYSETTPHPKEGKKVLIISSSPHKGGNTDQLCDAFAQGAAEAGGVVEKIFLYDYHLTPLTDKEIIDRKTDDDAELLIGKMLDADVIVLASPVWFMNVDAQLKMLFDKTYFHFTEITDKEFYYITASADTREDSCLRALLGFKGFVQVLPGAVERGSLIAPAMGRSGAVQNTDYITRSYNLGKTINNH